MPREFEGMSAADGCTWSLGDMETPGALVVARVPSVSVSVCVVMSATPCASETPCVSGLVTSEPENVLPSAPCVKGAPQPETARVCEPLCVSETPRVSAPVWVGSVVCG